jgi:hypothetical protein
MNWMLEEKASNPAYVVTITQHRTEGKHWKYMVCKLTFPYRHYVINYSTAQPIILTKVSLLLM